MNIAIIIGVLLKKPSMAERGDYFATFQLGSIEEKQKEATFFNCIARGSVAYKLYLTGDTGRIIFARGRVLYNKEKNSNFLEITSFMDLSNSESLVPVNLKEFLDIYNPSKVLENIRKSEKEQKAEAKKLKENNNFIPEDIPEVEENEFGG